MAGIMTPSVCVIGAGPGGLAAATEAARYGASVVLVEHHRIGGESLSYGCIPSKALIAAARRAQAMREAGKFGLRPVEPEINHRLVHEHVQGVITGLLPNMSPERLAGLGVEFVAGAARFKDKGTVVAGDAEIRARRFVIATGSSPAIPPIPGINRVPYYTNQTIFGINYRMGHLVILGGNQVGMELAQAYRRLGSEVTVLEVGSLLPEFDAEMSALAVQRLRDEGVRILDKARVERLEQLGQNVQVVFTKDGRSYSIDGTHLLISTGRRPNVEGLNLEAAGVKFDRDGISVSRRMKTSNPRIYAIGDVTGGLTFTHNATHQAGIAVRNALFRLPSGSNEAGIARAAFTEPELAQVGLTEDEARKGYQKLRILRWPFLENDKARTQRSTEGFLKVVATANGRILGAGAVGSQASEIIQLWSLAMQHGVTIRSMAGYAAVYPSLTEINQKAASAYFLPSLANPMLRRLVGWLERLG